MVSRQSDDFGAFERSKVWARNVTGQRLQILRDCKGGEYSSSEFDRFLEDAGIRRIRDTPQQPGISERLNRTLGEGIRCDRSMLFVDIVCCSDGGLYGLSS